MLSTNYFIIQQRIRMSGTGTGRGSGRAHFRSKSGCCICGTKSSSSRFTASERYAEHFGNCFGEGAADRSGDLCNACVLCVKRWLSRGKEIGRFKQVLDSKQGPGPKHMKEIAKRARRREAKKQQQQQITQQLQKHLIHHNHQSFSSRITGSSNSHNRATSLSKNSHSLSSSTNNNSTPVGHSGSSRTLHSSHQHHSHYGHHLATCVFCWAHQNNDTKVPSTNSVSSTNGNGLAKNSATTSTPLANAGGSAFPPPASGVNFVRTRSSVSRKLDLASKSNNNLDKAELDGLNNLANFSTSLSSSSLHYVQGHSDSSSFISASLSRSGFGESSSDNHSQSSLQHNFEQFRPPRPPPGVSHQSGGVMIGNVSGLTCNGNLSGGGVLTRAASAASNCFTGFFDGGASSTCSSTTSTPSTPTRRQNRRTRLPPVKISSSGIELDDILRKIQKDSKNMNLDNHQINMAVQREIRLRNRIINPPPMVGSCGPNRTPSTSSAHEHLVNLTTAASTTTLSDAASVEGSSVDAASNSAANLRV
nr:protein FAM60A [Hymenolepis microstoma]